MAMSNTSNWRRGRLRAISRCLWLDHIHPVDQVLEAFASGPIERMLLSPLDQILQKIDDHTLDQRDDRRIKSDAETLRNARQVRSIRVNSLKGDGDAHNRADEPNRRNKPYEIAQHLIVEINPVGDDVDARVENRNHLIDGFGGKKLRDGYVDQVWKKSATVANVLCGVSANCPESRVR